MRDEINAWRHVFKLDPDRLLSDDDLEQICMSGTDAIMIGGSSGVTYDNTVDLMSRVRRYALPCVLEVSDLEAVVPGFDLYMIPLVLNTDDSRWMIGQHVLAIEQYSHLIPWELIVPEGYIVLHADCTVARLTGAHTALEADRASAYAQAAERLLRLPIVYIEYSGRFGDMELVADVRRATREARIFYGGGIVDANTARQAASYCDTIIVGNGVYGDLQQALATVAAVKG
ncbi:heptaprenylglyceryl phosphate synthase [Paenibacillus campi]|uniref:heptaprenylglyceryl phosphate synthase n=1 Tax=Paenibacillus campi TaxID=3106031 RepID=UPI002AFEB6CC|nr:MULTISPECIES: heptaprenylglyceryl phosphate synthase [unclassified Paenibacillus]